MNNWKNELEINKNNRNVSTIIWSNKNSELEKILSFWEKYKEEWNKLKKHFWSKKTYNSFTELLMQYNELKNKFIDSLSNEEKELLEWIEGISKERFIKEYLFDIILFSWELKKRDWPTRYSYTCNKLDMDRLKWIAIAKKPYLTDRTEVDLSATQIWDEWVDILTNEWENELQPWMKIELWSNNITDKWIEILAKRRKRSLKPWIRIILDNNKFWKEWIEILAKEWKDYLQPWMEIVLTGNNLWDEWIKILFEQWWPYLQPWMKIDLINNGITSEWIKIITDLITPIEWLNLDFELNKIGDKWAEIFARKRKNKIKQWMLLKLSQTWIWDKWAIALANNWKNSLEEWVWLMLWDNDVWINWAKELLEKINLKNWCVLGLWRGGNSTEAEYNEIKKVLKEYEDKWIKCYIFSWYVA
jgi:hypothetical protein